jgi:hypothetical protein
MKRTSAIILIIASAVLLMFACVSNQPPKPIGRFNIGYLTPEGLKALCEKNGGHYSAPGAPGGVYYCLLPDGGLIACGGTIDTCTWDPRGSGKPPPHDFVSRVPPAG